MKPSSTLLAILLTVSAATRAQVVPPTTGPAGLSVSGILRYDLRYSQTAQVGGSQGGQQWSYASGDASYANASQRLPFSMQYGGGYGLNWAGSSSTGNIFQHLSLSQGIAGRAWNLTASDNVSYSFETPTTGFSGVPGTGEPIGGSGSTTPPDQTILALNTRTLDNFATIGFTDRLNYAWSLNAGGSSGQLRYIDNNGLDMDTLMANAGITRRLNALNSISGQYSFSRYNYSGVSFTTQANSAQLSYSRLWNRQISTSASVGPQWLSSSDSNTMPSSTRISVSALASDTFRHGAASLIYNHGTTGGSGYMLGAKMDSVSANLSREFGRNLTVEMTGSYMRTASLIAAELSIGPDGNVTVIPLNVAGVSNTRYGGAQATRKLGRYLNVFASYTAISQSSDLQITSQNSSSSYNANILNGLYQVIGFGIGYSPREKHLKK
jgi:hypothetical protein